MQGGAVWCYANAMTRHESRMRQHASRMRRCIISHEWEGIAWVTNETTQVTSETAWVTNETKIYHESRMRRLVSRMKLHESQIRRHESRTRRCIMMSPKVGEASWVTNDTTHLESRMTIHIISHEWSDTSHEREDASWLVKNEETHHESRLIWCGTHIMSDSSWWVTNEKTSQKYSESRMRSASWVTTHMMRDSHYEWLIMMSHWPPPHNQIYSRNWYVILCGNSQSFHLRTGGGLRFSIQAMSWTGSFRTFIVHDPWMGSQTARIWLKVE